jgi:hypothetical protein
MPRARKRDTNTNDHDTSTAPQATGDTMVAGDNRDRVAARAYERYLARGGEDGLDLDDWLAAERELTNANGHEFDPTRES